jgi:carbamoyl-phosphate synthase large subunit
MIRILLTSVGRRVELVQAFRNAANRLGIRLTIIGADITDTAPALVYCDRTVIVPRISNPEYIPALLQICREQQIDGLLPTIDTDLLLLSENKESFAEIGTQVLISRPEKIRICRDKRNTSAYFNSLGLYAPEAVSDIKDYRGGFPAFIKPIDGSSSIGANRADDLQELQMYADQLGSYVIQPFAAGTEYTVDVFCDWNGAPVYITPRVRVAVRGGEVLKTHIHHQESVISEIQTLIADFKPCGPMTVQLIRDEK